MTGAPLQGGFRGELTAVAAESVWLSRVVAFTRCVGPGRSGHLVCLDKAR